MPEVSSVLLDRLPFMSIFPADEHLFPPILPGETLMAEHHSGPVEVGAAMDYSEHEKTYKGFTAVAKYGTMMIALLLLCMAAGFYTKAGFLFSTLLFVVLNLIGFFLL